MSAVGREEQGEELPRLQLLSSFKNVFGFAAVVAAVSIVVCLGLSPVSVLHSDSSAQQEHKWYEDELDRYTPLQSPVKLWAENPTFLVCELVFYFGTLLTLWHATGHGRHHLLIWVAAVVSGTANDIFFMVLPFSDNFYHAQGLIMLTPRLPLYIPCCYIVFMYPAVVAAWRLGLPWLSEAGATALGAAVFYAAFDVTGAKHLWWSWHDTDGGVFHRWLGVPIGSTMWTLVHMFCFSLTLRFLGVLTTRTVDAVVAAGTVLFMSIICTPFMMAAMGPFQMHQLRLALASEPPFFRITQMPGKPDHVALGLVIATYVVLVRRGLAFTTEGVTGPQKKYAWLTAHKRKDAVLLLGIVVYYLVMLGCMAFGRPEDVVAEGCHQAINPCAVVGYDLSNYSRFEFLCPNDYDEDFTFDCERAGGVARAADLPHRTTWYTICGKRHSNRLLYVAAVAALGFVGIKWFARALGGGVVVAGGGWQPLPPRS